MEVIDLNAFREQKRLEAENAERRRVALDCVEKSRMSDSTKYNYEFYSLVDLFMQEHYPDYLWKFNVWLDGIEKKGF